MQINDRQILDLANEAHDFFVRADKAYDEADRRHRDIVTVHRDGWKSTADAILKGFGLVADAIRASNR